MNSGTSSSMGSSNSGDLFSPLVERALRVAADAHRQQSRKGSSVPYITHPLGVVLLLLKAGWTDDAVLAAALLHDTLEDTEYPAARLEAEFEPPVPQYVAALSERKRDAAGNPRNWRDRKLEHLQQIAAAPQAVRAVALADKLHNLATIRYDLGAGEEVWSRFNAPQAEILWYHAALIDAAAGNDRALESLAAPCRALLAELGTR
jgi:(p)ppGpp synthase/HD superfamily hydrolase